MNIANNFLAAAATTAAMTVVGVAPAAAEKWDMPMAYAASNYHSENGAEFAKCVTEKGVGLEVVTHPGGSLFKGGDIKRAVQTGQANIGERLISAHENENPLYGIDSIPFLATSFDDSEKLWRAAGDKIQAALAEENLVYIYAVPWPPQGLYTNKPVEAVADLAGIKFRAYNTATARIAELGGMVPVQIEAAELSQALATGVAEAFISSGSTGYDRKVWEQLSHFYDTQAWLPRNVVFANKDAWDALDASAQGAIIDCGTAASERGLAKARELTDFYVKGLAENGMTVAEPSEQLRNELKGFGETMTNEWLESAGEEGKAIIDTFKSM